VQKRLGLLRTETLHRLSLVVTAGDDYRDIRTQPSEGRQRLPAVHPGHGQIKKDETDGFLPSPECVHRLHPVTGLNHPVTQFLQLGLGEPPNHRVIVCHEHQRWALKTRGDSRLLEKGREYFLVQDGKDQSKGCAPARFALNRDCSSKRANQSQRYRHSQPPAGELGGEKWIENTLPDFCVHAAARVGNRETGIALCLGIPVQGKEPRRLDFTRRHHPSGHGDFPFTVADGLDGVGDQVGQNLSDVHLIRLDERPPER